jgi:prepilin-type N-terminal cleavage/methylation domain-containing protein
MTTNSTYFETVSDTGGTLPRVSAQCSGTAATQRRSAGLSLPELMIGMAIAAILTAMSVPVVNSTMARMRMNSAVSAISTSISKARYRAIRNSDVYTLTITVPQNTYVVTDVTTNVADSAVPLPNTVAINGGNSAVITYTLCPNGIVYGAGGTCTNNTNAPPALTVTYSQLQTNINVSTVGNVTTTVIH